MNPACPILPHPACANLLPILFYAYPRQGQPATPPPSHRCGGVVVDSQTTFVIYTWAWRGGVFVVGDMCADGTTPGVTPPAVILYLPTTYPIPDFVVPALHHHCPKRVWWWLSLMVNGRATFLTTNRLRGRGSPLSITIIIYILLLDVV